MSKKKKPTNKTKISTTTTRPAPSRPAAASKSSPAAQRRTASKKSNKGFFGNTQNLLWIGLAAVALVVVVVILINRPPVYTNSLPGTISVAEAYQRYQAGTFVLDVRTQEEWDEYHAPNTIHIPLDELENRLSELPQDEDIVVICRSGNRSQEGRDILLKNGFTAVTSVEGGLKEWSTAGYPIEGTRPQ